MHNTLPQQLQRDLQVLQARRRLLALLAGAGASALGVTACGGGGSDTGTTTGTGSTASTGSTVTPVGTCSVIPEETAGPYPGDGSNMSNSSVSNVLVQTGVVRSDIRSSFGGFTGTAAGVALNLNLRLVNTNGQCADLSGYAIYAWHCDRDGKYSLYDTGVTNQNYLRGVQATDANGFASFVTIFPGCYAGRVPHIHFEIFRSTGTATAFSNKLRTSQLALPTAVCTTVYATATGYGTSATNLSRISFATDNVFSDGVTSQLATVTGNVTDGYVANLTVGIAA